MSHCGGHAQDALGQAAAPDPPAASFESVQLLLLLLIVGLIRRRRPLLEVGRLGARDMRRNAEQKHDEEEEKMARIDGEDSGLPARNDEGSGWEAIG